MISDSIKMNIKKIDNKDLPGFIYFWLEFGLRNKKDYIESAMLHTLPLWYPRKILNDSRMYHPYIEYDNTTKQTAKIFKTDIYIKRMPILKGLNETLHKFVYQNGINWQDVFIFRIIFMPATYLILLLLLFVKTIISRNWELLLPLSLVAGLFICLFLSPVIIFRYIFPIVVIAPLLLTLLFDKQNQPKI